MATKRSKLVPIRIVSCLAMLAFLVTMGMRAWGAVNKEESAAQRLTLSGKAEGKPTLTLAADGKTKEEYTYNIEPSTPIYLNGERATVKELQDGDQVSVTKDAAGSPVSVDAVRKSPGFIISFNGTALNVTTDYLDRHTYTLQSGAKVTINGKNAALSEVRRGDQILAVPNKEGLITKLEVIRTNPLAEFWHNFCKNLFKPLLLFFYLGFSVPLLKIAFDFPATIYQGLTIYLLLSIGWHGGEELATLSGQSLAHALRFVVVGFCLNLVLGLVAYFVLRGWIPRMRKIDAATVAAYYGSDSAGTFVTCLGVLQAAHIAFAAYMPVMLAVMEIPGCLVGLYLVSMLRKAGMDANGNMPGEQGYDAGAKPANIQIEPRTVEVNVQKLAEQAQATLMSATQPRQELVMAHAGEAQSFTAAATAVAINQAPHVRRPNSRSSITAANANRVNETIATAAASTAAAHGGPGVLFREVFLNPGLFLLFGGIVIGFVSRSQGYQVTEPNDKLFVTLFQGLLCLFLLEMGMTAAKHLKDLQACGWRFIVFGLVIPNVFATTGIIVAHIFSHLTGVPFQLGTYALFAVLCGAASYIAVPAIQRIAIPEASPTLPLAASLGLTFSYNVTIGIPLYIVIAQQIIKVYPVLTT